MRYVIATDDVMAAIKAAAVDIVVHEKPLDSHGMPLGSAPIDALKLDKGEAIVAVTDGKAFLCRDDVGALRTQKDVQFWRCKAAGLPADLVGDAKADDDKGGKKK